ncbi:phage virion morphogenesis (putative tail completion) protein [Marinitoga hydrogenitolerans DSM 16785]|uniref:Phage virion morphogenesis (Putative tail completion) protein n=1 Tax=Marinitoga hydrogenitolerans (strain DSM 16785 / JCM 12826 / AT1271) TaxID=1122195 RepID=A0A1M4TUF6_MARH1|nr:phage virion morphogenesis protein [Marinitoga hydrogenitolerans]SHE48058.1 phage virion morphogenesis (putative tail completion) protein [Marinitoga hydrogenitolerans DSM 16785]
MKIIINDKELKKKLSELKRKTNDLTPVMKDTALIMKQSILKNFDDQGTEQKKWKDLSRKTKKRKQKEKGTSYPILVDTGRLKKSFNTSYTKYTARVYTGVKYGVYHQTGTRKIPKRPFMHVRKEHLETIKRLILKYLEE